MFNNKEFFKKNLIKRELPIAVLSAATISSIFISCSKNDGKASANNNPDLNFSEGLEKINLPGEGVTFNKYGIGVDGSYQEPVEIGGVYQIANVGNLYWFANHVNEGNTEANAVLVNDINIQWELNQGEFDKFSDEVAKWGSLDVEDDEYIKKIKDDWVPIGKGENFYIGEFNGDGHTIKGIYCASKEQEYVGLFGGVGLKANIHDVRVEYSCFESGGEKYRAIGAIAGYAFGEAEISRCEVENVYLRDNERKGESNIGGILGNNYGATVVDCSSNVRIEAAAADEDKIAYIGGLCGSVVNEGVLKNSGAVVHDIEGIGGERGIKGYICGLVDGGTVENCYYQENSESKIEAIGETKSGEKNIIDGNKIITTK